MLRVEGLEAGYGSLQVLREVSFEIPDGAVVAILGANGAGKTTLLRTLSGLIPTRGGSITLAGKRIERLSPERRVRRGMALVPEGRELFGSLTVREHLIVGAFTRADRHAVETDIARVLAYFPRLKARLNEPGASLSGGEGQMLSIGRALMARPRMLLLDEPSQGLAPAVVEAVFAVLAQLHRDEGLTTLLVEQNARMALAAASSAYVLQGGTIALHGTPEELGRNQAVRALYLGGDSDDAQQANDMQPPDAGDQTRVDMDDGALTSGSASERKEPSMTAYPLLSGLSARDVETARLRTHVLERSVAGGKPVMLVHGNASASRFFEELMLALPADCWALAPDLRGYGASERKPVDATRGVRDWSDDLHALSAALGLGEQRKPHLVGWSMGAGVVMQYALDHPSEVASLTLISPLSPYGFGGTKDERGTLCWPDAAGSGGGTVNPDFVTRLAAGDRSADSPNSPRNVMNAFYFKPPFRAAPEREDVFVEAVLSTVIGDDYYPGDTTTSDNWPATAPGPHGINNAMAPRYCNLSAFAELTPRPPVLWVRGADDQIVSDTSFFDLGFLGQLGAVPGWPGAEIYPPQPMVTQMRAVLDRYRANGGSYEEAVIEDAGHSPFVERPDAFQRRFLAFLAAN